MKAFFFLLLIVLTSFCFSQSGKSQLITDLGIFSGSWKGEAFGGTAEEIWSRPSSGTLMGMFRLTDSVKTILYEFLVIEEDSEGVFLKFKHISPGYEEAEEQPITLELSELSNNRYVFKSQDERGDPNKIIYEYKDSTNLLITVDGFEDGELHSFNIQMKKVK